MSNVNRQAKRNFLKANIKRKTQSLHRRGYSGPHWNNEPCTIRRGTGTLLDSPEFSQFWGKPFVGQRRKIIEITQNQNTWIIDDEDGDGTRKLNNGGTWVDGHKSGLYTDIQWSDK